MLQPTSETQRDFAPNRLRAPACAPGPALSWPHTSLHFHVCVCAPVSICVCACMRVRVYIHTHAGLLMWGEGLCQEAWCWIHVPRAPHRWLLSPQGLAHPFQVERNHQALWDWLHPRIRWEHHALWEAGTSALKQRPVWGEAGRGLLAPPGGRRGGKERRGLALRHQHGQHWQWPGPSEEGTHLPPAPSKVPRQCGHHASFLEAA